MASTLEGVKSCQTRVQGGTKADLGTKHLQKDLEENIPEGNVSKTYCQPCQTRVQGGTKADLGTKPLQEELEENTPEE